MPAHVAYDCVVVGGGHAGSCAALSAAEYGCQRVLIIDKCPKDWSGGNGYFTAGAHRTVHDGLHDLLPIVNNVSPELASSIDMDPYTADQFTWDIMRLGESRSDPNLVKALVDGSRDAVRWLAEYVRVPFTFSFNRQAYEVNGRQKFWGGMVLSVQDGGKGLIAAHHKALERERIEVWYDSPAVELVMERGRVVGVLVERQGEVIQISAGAVILACGGFESSPELRRKHLGDSWIRARVRGTPYNTGDGISIASSIGAKLTGDWSGCHSTCWDVHAPINHGSRTLSNQFTKSGYPLGIMVNTSGLRFVDEGADFRNYTYAKYGRAILNEDDGAAWQVFDGKIIKWLREEEYGNDVAELVWAQSINELGDRMAEDGLKSKETFLKTVTSFNEAILTHHHENPHLEWNPSIKDNLSTQSTSTSLSPPKSNWALPIDCPPFLAVKVSCGITFTFGGLAIDPESGGVLSAKSGNNGETRVIEGLFCTGEMVGGLFYGNYPGGSGLTGGAVFGRKAGREAAKLNKVFRTP
ncbi:hypothetical protein JAAARDRAFT_122325 [Jaapia argillacea MUCL 33604]|uniref:FAD-dependent oxidoreductase 2 FAD binding domain-containing protein n=1 Tax=Jaapia argillacea MUCL 33604 TaxID=933084 RepID=A0A067Q678_9AGAM|nr:hypothetical protein JAAARDRAFT_122325 [Jaapia argillacea MUCL 33604]